MSWKPSPWQVVGLGSCFGACVVALWAGANVDLNQAAKQKKRRILGRIIRSSFKSRKYEILHRIHSDKYTSLRPSLLEAIYDRFSSLLEDEEVGKLSKPAFKEALGEMEIANDDIRNTIYASWDNDRNGYVDFLELVEGVDAIFHEDHQSRLDRLFNVFDLDGNGRIDVGELEQIFNTFVKEQDPQLAQQKVAAIMAACDLDNSKNITRQEFGELMWRDHHHMLWTGLDDALMQYFGVSKGQK